MPNKPGAASVAPNSRTSARTRSSAKRVAIQRAPGPSAAAEHQFVAAAESAITSLRQAHRNGPSVGAGKLARLSGCCAFIGQL